MTVHYLKTVPPFFAAVANGEKQFEVRFNDRAYQTGDFLVLREFDLKRARPYGSHNDCDRACSLGSCAFTGRELPVEVTFVYTGSVKGRPGQQVSDLGPGYVALGIKHLDELP